jgi:hypothetical protein
MSNATPSRLGAINEGVDKLAMFLKVFAGEVLTTFEETNVAEALQMTRSISSGKSAQFPVTGVASAAYHSPGTEILGGSIKHAERVISIDDLLLASVFIANIDEAMNHYDVRSIYSTEVGRALAKQYDINILQVMILAARASATITGGNGGSALTNASYGTDGAVLAAGLFEANQKLDEKDVPENDRYAIVKPAQYYLMVKTTDVINRDWGGSGTYAEGKVLKVAGLHIVKSNHLPSTNVTTGPTAYQGNFTNTRAVVVQKGAVGTVKLLDLATESEYDIRRQGTLIVSKYAVGHGILRPECAVELKTA